MENIKQILIEFHRFILLKDYRLIRPKRNGEGGWNNVYGEDLKSPIEDFVFYYDQINQPTYDI